MPLNYPSAQLNPQWTQSTVGAIQMMNWGLARQYVHVTDSGEIWIVAVRWERAFANGTDFGGYFVGRVLPDGSIQRVSPDVYADEGSCC